MNLVNMDQVRKRKSMGVFGLRKAKAFFYKASLGDYDSTS